MTNPVTRRDHPSRTVLAPTGPAGGPTSLETPSAEPACPNCGTSAPLAYCPACGQAQHALHRSVRSIVADALDTFAGWDGKIPVTLWLLVRHPGRLTADYVAGRRARYLPPLRLYLTMGALLVVAFRLAEPRTRGLQLHMQGEPGAPRVVTAGTAPAPSTLGPWQKLKHSYFGARIKSLEGMSEQERQREVRTAFFGRLGATFFALLPVVALLLGLLYFRGPLVYAEHLVFALHVHAFAAAAFAVALALPVAAGAWRAVPLLALPPYLFVALRTVYGGSRRRTLAKCALLGLGYLLAVSVLMTLTVLVAFLFG